MSSKPPEESKQYSAQSIRVMEGLEAVRKRPGMYIGSTGPNGLHHLVYELVDNSVDEALAGHCSHITVTLNTDGSCSVEDDGRGIPTDIHPTEGISAVEVALTKLHAGGKFDKDTYKFSGGLHGVGVSVVNALSKQLNVTIFRNGTIYSQDYAQGKALRPLAPIGSTDKRGTLVRFTPDNEIFTETTAFNFKTLSARLKELAFLNKGLRITLIDTLSSQRQDFHFEGGIVSFVEHINAKRTVIDPVVIYFKKIDNNYELECALQYNDTYDEQLFSFVNNINTIEGGTHVTGLKTALTRVYNRRAQEMKIVKPGEAFSSEDVREGLVCVLNIKLMEPQFEGQTKTKLGNSEAKGIVESATFAALENYFEENPAIARKIFQKAETAMRARAAAKKARELTRQKTGLDSVILPGKLSDCASDVPADSELFIVEGDSAGGSAKQGRNRQTQAILPLKGKILNVEKARIEKILSNEEIKALIAAIGCGIKDELDIEKVRYHKIILMTDADVDGSHIRTLLLTFFFRYMRPLITQGYLYIAQPPLYKVKLGRHEQYLKDDRAFQGFIFGWARSHLELFQGDASTPSAQWHSILESLLIYESTIDKIARTFRIGHEQSNQLALFCSKANAPFESDDELFTALRTYFTQYTINRSAEDELTARIIMQKDDLSWSIPKDFIRNDTIIQASKLINKTLALLEEPWKLTVTEKERSITGSGITALITAINAICKPYLQVQRYKGLGEMNAEQLWETAMNPAMRNLLQVRLEDIPEAELWFYNLMGDDVGERRQFIEENGQFVKHLDV